MSDDDSITTGERRPLLIADHRIAVLVSVTVLISLVFTSVGLSLYNGSGTVQVDLSRPDYAGVTDDSGSSKKDTYVEYPAVGPINQEALDEFNKTYSEQVDNVKSVDAFSGNPLAPDALGIDSQDN